MADMPDISSKYVAENSGRNWSREQYKRKKDALGHSSDSGSDSDSHIKNKNFEEVKNSSLKTEKIVSQYEEKRNMLVEYNVDEEKVEAVCKTMSSEETQIFREACNGLRQYLAEKNEALNQWNELQQAEDKSSCFANLKKKALSKLNTT